MSKVDDELTRRLRRAERPVDPDGLFERLERRRTHRERLRKVQVGMLGFAVLAATAGGFTVLREAFQPDDHGPAVSPPLGAPSVNGEIVFVKAGDDSRLHIYAAQPDGSGERQLTEGPTDDSDPAVSPDGRRVAFVRILDERTQRIAIVGIDGGEVTQLTAEDSDLAADPTWSPDGTTLAYVTTGVDSMQLATTEIETGQLNYLVDFFGQLANPTWSPDGTRIALGVVSGGSQGSIGIIRTNTMSEQPQLETLGVGTAPAWSPDGSTIALIRPGVEGDQIWTVAPVGNDEASLEPDLAWAPDGASLLVSDGDWIYRVDSTPQGDPAGNFQQLVRGTSPSW
jgi:dipeptidyl aminopeptidase/acylaminoacyl peptidase